MRMFSGQLVDPLNLKVEDIRADDICWALANICRYGGHCHRHYSVAEHSLTVATMTDPKKALFALLHDASEAYLGDIPTPLKRRLPAFQEAEVRAQATVARAFDLSPTDFLREIETGEVKRNDIGALKFEQNFLWNPVERVGKPFRPELVAANLYAAIKSHTPRHLDFKKLGLDKAHIFS